MDATAVTVAALAGVPALAAAWYTYRASTRAATAQAEAARMATNLESRKVDQEAYDRAQAIYEKALAEAEKQAERMQKQVDQMRGQVDRLNEQLAKEQDVSNSLRNQVRTLQVSVDSMESTMVQLRAQLGGQRR